jgi:hypothetical protein
MKKTHAFGVIVEIDEDGCAHWFISQPGWPGLKSDTYAPCQIKIMGDELGRQLVDIVAGRGTADEGHREPEETCPLCRGEA